MQNSRLRLLFIHDFLKNTDEDHRISTPEIIAKLKKQGIDSERKTVIKDINSLEEYGESILRPSGNHLNGYALLEPLFENYEWKILADTVAAAHFLTNSDSKQLIEKIKKLATPNGRILIDKTTLINDIYKSEDFRNKYKLSQIFNSIIKQKQITFNYRIGENPEAPIKKKTYQVSSYALILWHEEYYLIAACKNHDTPTHFRVERMTSIHPTDENARPIEEIQGLTNKKKHPAILDYINKTNGLWGATQIIRLKLSCKKEIKSYLIRQFGKHLTFIPSEKDGVLITEVDVYDNNGLYYTLARYGNNIHVISPEPVRQKYISFIQNILKEYE